MRSCFTHNSAIGSSASRGMVAPVGLVGKLSSRIFDFGVIRLASSSARSWKLSLPCTGTETALPWARVTLGL